MKLTCNPKSKIGRFKRLPKNPYKHLQLETEIMNSHKKKKLGNQPGYFQTPCGNSSLHNSQLATFFVDLFKQPKPSSVETACFLPTYSADVQKCKMFQQDWPTKSILKHYKHGCFPTNQPTNQPRCFTLRRGLSTFRCSCWTARQSWLRSWARLTWRNFSCGQVTATCYQF